MTIQQKTFAIESRTTILKCTHRHGFEQGIVIENGMFRAHVQARGNLDGMMPTEFRVKGGENLIHISDQQAMRCGSILGGKPEIASAPVSEVVTTADGIASLQQVWGYERYCLKSAVSVLPDQACLYYDFELETREPIDRLRIEAALASKFNFNRFACGNPVREFRLGTCDFFQNWAVVWSDVRGEGLLLSVQGPGVHELQTSRVSWAFDEYAIASRYYEGTLGTAWQAKCSFLLDDVGEGEKRRFGWRLCHMDAYAPNAWARRADQICTQTFLDLEGDRGHLPEVSPQVKPVSVVARGKAQDRRPQNAGVLKVAHFTSMPYGQWGMEPNHPWKIPFLTDEHFKEGINRARDFGFNTICLWDGTYVMVNEGIKKRATRYAHAQGLKVWIMASRPYGTDTFPHFCNDGQNGIELVKRGIDTFCAAELGDEAVDGYGWDDEETPSPFQRGYGYYDGVMRSDNVMTALFRERFGKDMVDSTLENIRQGYAQLYGEWFGRVYEYLHSKNETCTLFTLASWYERYRARAETTNCPGIHIPVFMGGEGAWQLQAHGIRAWHNAGASVSILHREPYFEVYGIRPEEIDGVIKEAALAGADGLFYFDFALRSEEVCKAYAEAMNKYFPGDMSHPLPSYPVGTELPEYEHEGLSFDNIGDPDSLRRPAADRKTAAPIKEMDEVDDGT